jgi:hypothetical protein
VTQQPARDDRRRLRGRRRARYRLTLNPFGSPSKFHDDQDILARAADVLCSGQMMGTMLGLEQPEATLLASIVAAVASIASLLITARAAKRAERRAAQRTLVEATVEELSTAFHENVATAFILLEKPKGSQARTSALNRCKAASDELKALRPRVRIALRGIDEGLRTLSRVPDWAANYDDRVVGDELLQRADQAAPSTRCRGWSRLSERPVSVVVGAPVG